MKSANKKTGNLQMRILTAIIAGSAVVYAIYNSSYGLILFTIIISVMGIIEFHKINKINIFGVQAVSFFTLIIVFWLLELSFNFKDISRLTNYLWVLFPITAFLYLFNPRGNNSTKSLQISFMSIFYILVPSYLFYEFSFFDGKYNHNLPLFILILIWTNDTMAYFSGKHLGKHKLYEKVSPNKTWEGAIGGLLFTIGVGILLERLIPIKNYSWWITAIIVGVFGPIGDLVESKIKRSTNMKDSGGLLPGHGGFLDRFDAFYFVVPIIYIYFKYFNNWL